VQTGFAVAYKAVFKRDSLRVYWGDDVFKNRFYPGLKLKVKDDLISIQRDLHTFIKYINEAVIINDRLYEQMRDDKGKYHKYY
jgi:hypothetical protein